MLDKLRGLSELCRMTRWMMTGVSPENWRSRSCSLSALSIPGIPRAAKASVGALRFAGFVAFEFFMAFGGLAALAGGAW